MNQNIDVSALLGYATLRSFFEFRDGALVGMCQVDTYDRASNKVATKREPTGVVIVLA